MNANLVPGFISKASKRSVPETIERVTTILKSRGVAIFALVDHSGEAEKIGVKMRPTQLLIFGNPKAGTPLMLAAPSVAIDLPLKALAWEDGAGKVWLSFNSPDYLQQRHGFPSELEKNIAAIEPLLDQALA
ncbi:MAG: DUF302 domain-containing protein [Candidatus Acidiferrales bacterium]